MTTASVTKLASQILDLFTGGEPDADSRATIGQIELLIKQVAPAIRKMDFFQMMKEVGAQQINGQFVKNFTINLTSGGTCWKKAELPAPYLALPTNRGVVYVNESDGMSPIELIPKDVLANLAGGLLQSTGKYFACPVDTYLEIRGNCNTRLPQIRTVDVGLAVVGSELAVDEGSQMVIIERVLAVLKSQPMPDKNINANPV